MAVVMNRFTSGQGFWNCCAPCHSLLEEELCTRTGTIGDRPVGPIPFFGKGGEPLVPPSIIPAAIASARGGSDGSDWTPRAAAFGHGQRSSPQGLAPSPPQELCVDAGAMTGRSAATGSRSFANSRVPPEREGKAAERARLRRLVGEFMQEVSSTARFCNVISLGDGVGGALGARRIACYELVDEAERLVIRGKAEEQLELIVSCPLRAVLGAHKAEESALVRRCKAELLQHISEEELAASAVLEFGPGASAVAAPLLIIEETVQQCERLVAALQILRLYKGVAQRAESARNGAAHSRHGCSPARVPQMLEQPPAAVPNTSTVSTSRVAPPNRVAAHMTPAGPARQVPPESALSGRPATMRGVAFRAPGRLGMVADDEPAFDGVGGGFGNVD